MLKEGGANNFNKNSKSYYRYKKTSHVYEIIVKS